MHISPQTAMDDTRVWLERAVIGLNLCPFAKSVHVKGQIHYAVSAAQTTDAFLEDLIQELEALAAHDATARDTTLLIAPDCLADFLDFNDFLAQADQALVDLDLDGVLQIANLHPDYQFAGTAADDITNYTNRSPYPTLHLLREDSIDRAVDAFPEAETIFEKNMATMERIGPDGWAALGVGRSQGCPHALPGTASPQAEVPGRMEE
ncbi:MAG: peptidase [Burkholderiales bacterium RIFCSPLOWO2_12_FULL_61_40]|nr:MAG: peptidase [Burkholderiales bacterium RIFCSPLOWO2_12_FULL_61_40]